MSFDDPPYGLRLKGTEAHRTLFPWFCRLTGLLPDQDIQVLDWVGYPDRDPACSDWSPYFDDGKEWSGIWCFTVWNPRSRTLAAIAASATD